jgi:transcriptional regulator with XRE-family HTH domain
MEMAETEIDRAIGARVRRLRDERGLTLDALAARSGVSRAMLSRIERGESSPTAQLLAKVCGGLGVTMPMLFAPEASRAEPLSRHTAQPVWRDPGSGYLRRTVSPPGTGSAAEITEVVFPPGATVAFEAQQADADQQVWVLDGKLDLTVGDDLYQLESGDCLHMRFGRPIVFHNPYPRPVRYAVVIARRSLG